MSRVVSALCSLLLLPACSMGHVALPFPAPATAVHIATPAQPEAPNAAQKTGLGGPQVAASVASGANALDLINGLRQEKGLKLLTISPELTRAAQSHALALARAGTLTHVGPDGSTPIDRVRHAGYRPAMAAENIAGGQASIAEAVRSWRDSESHLRNMLLPDATHMGIAQVNDPRSPMRSYWTLVLGASRS
jgi:uncharacterized protein YkwD